MKVTKLMAPAYLSALIYVSGCSGVGTDILAGRNALQTGHPNDAIGYLPTRESFPQGGYEVTVGSTVYEPGTGERLVDAAVGQLQRLFVES